MLTGMAVSQQKIILNSDGKAWRPHLHLNDVCEAFRCCIDWDYDGGQLMVLNVGRNDNNMRIIDVAELIQRKIENTELEFLNPNEDSFHNDLIRDKKIQDGVDKKNLL